MSGLFQEITLDTFIFNSKELPSNLTIDNETDEDTIIGIEDQILEIACNVESGSPPENISWILNGTVLYTGGPKRIIHKFRANRTDHNSKLTCEVTSNLTDAPLRKTVHLNIKCDWFSFLSNLTITITTMLYCTLYFWSCLGSFFLIRCLAFVV